MVRYKKYRTRRYKKGAGKRISGFRKSKSILKNRIFWDIVLVSILIIELFYALFFSQIFKIKDVKIVSPKEISKEELQVFLQNELQDTVFYFFKRENLFLANTNEIKNEILESYPEIKKVTLKREFPKGLLLEVEERQPFGILNTHQGEFLIDEEGIAFKKVPQDFKKQDLIFILVEQEEIELGASIIIPETMQKISLVKEELKDKINIIPEIFYLTGGRLNVKTLEGWEIYFNISEDLKEIKFALTKLSLLLEKEIDEEERKNLEYIDLRFSKVYYK